MTRAKSASESASLAAQLKRMLRVDDVQLSTPVQVLWGGYGEIRRATLSGRPGIQHIIVKWVRPPSEASLRGDPRALRSHVRKLRSYAVEAKFYERYAARCTAACRVPRAYEVRIDAQATWFVLEDLDAAGFAARAACPDQLEAEACLRWLAAFHARFLGAAPEGLWKRGTYWHLATRADELAALDPTALKRAAGAIDARLNAARFQTFVHGDAKLENFCFDARHSAVAAVDFQYVGGGVGVKDVAYFLSSCFEGEVWAALEEQLLDGYFRALRTELTAADPAPPVEYIDALEREWRELYPYAVADFHRFLLGWAPRSRPDPHSARVTESVLRGLACSG